MIVLLLNLQGNESNLLAYFNKLRINKVDVFHKISRGVSEPNQRLCYEFGFMDLYQIKL